jgi:hypothetical protein
LDRARTSLRAIALPCGFLITDDHPRDRPNRTASDWWTGKDSNLRSPQGAADLQSAGFSHSPTRPAKNKKDAKCLSPKTLQSEIHAAQNKNTKRTRVKRHQPVYFSSKDLLRLAPLKSWWSWRRELNPRPSDYKSDALPAELRQRRSNRVRIAEGARELQVGARFWSTSGARSVEKVLPCVALLAALSFNSSIV